MILFNKTKAENSLLDTSKFPVGIIESTSNTVQKAFKDIQEKLVLATEEYDGLLSSVDKEKLNNFQKDILLKEKFIAIENQDTLILAENPNDCAVYVDGLLINDDNYIIVENEIVFESDFDTGAEIIIYYSNFLNNLNIVDDSIESALKTWSSSKISETFNKLIRKFDFDALEDQTEFACTGLETVIDVFVAGMKLRDTEYSLNGNVVTLNEQVAEGEWVQIVG